MTGRALVPSSGDFADDDGTADPRLEAALARVNGPEEVSAALLDARLLVPILTTPLSAEHGPIWRW